jgi:hypothetical protein
MKFLSFIASTMLIVLISQHSTMGLPLNETVVEKPCLEGFKMINGQCMQISLKPNDSEVKPLSPIIKPKALDEEPVIEKEHACGEGMEYDKNGICQEVLYFTTVPTITDTMPVFKNDPVILDGHCAEGMKHGEHGICEPIDSIEITTAFSEILDHTENLFGCPEGTKHDEQGACQEIEPTKPTKLTTDPKVFLNPDGSCPENYKMAQGKCVYLNSKLKPKYPGLKTKFAVNHLLEKSGNEESAMFEKVPLLADNSCPEGTEYSEFGLCQKRINSTLSLKPDGTCSDDFELIGGKCTFKKSKVHDEFLFSTTASTLLVQSELTTFIPEPIKNVKLPERVVDSDSSIETATVIKPVKIFKTQPAI